MVRLLAAAAAISSAGALFADDLPLYDKTAYTIFNPTPAGQMRPLTSDEFDKVVNPFTVDAGHVQLETDLVEWYSETDRGTFASGETYDRFDAEFTWYPTIKIGLCNNADIEIEPGFTDKYSHQTGLTASPGFTTGSPPSAQSYTITHSSESFGDVDLGPKINFWGNDGGTTALGISPFIAIPTDHGDVTGGADIPFAVRLPLQIMVKYSLGIYAIETGGGTIHGEFANRLTIEETFAEKLTAFLNVNGLVTSQNSHGWWGYTGFGAGYDFTPNFQVYAAIRFGIGPDAYDLDPYCGIAWRY